MTELTVHLLRHAHAAHVTAGQRDHLRELDQRGLGEVARLRQRLSHRTPVVDAITCSTATRARQTLQPLLTHFRGADVRYDDALYAMGTDAYEAACLAARPSSSILIVGHNPMIEQFIGRCVTDATSVTPIAVKPATWVTLELRFGVCNGLYGGKVLSVTPAM